MPKILDNLGFGQEHFSGGEWGMSRNFLYSFCASTLFITNTLILVIDFYPDFIPLFMWLRNDLHLNIVLYCLRQDLHTGYEIKAANGRMFPALKVFSHALKFFKDHVLAELSDQSTAKLTEEDITWVLTVPAIWRQPAKQFMRTAAYEVKLVLNYLIC